MYVYKIKKKKTLVKCTNCESRFRYPDIPISCLNKETNKQFTSYKKLFATKCIGYFRVCFDLFTAPSIKLNKSEKHCHFLNTKYLLFLSFIQRNVSNLQEDTVIIDN